MRISRCRILRYRLPLVAPLVLSGRVLRERTGVLVRIDSDCGASGWGDVAPLPGFSRESIEDAEREATALAERLRGAEIDCRKDDLESRDCVTPMEPLPATPTTRTEMNSRIAGWDITGPKAGIPGKAGTHGLLSRRFEPLGSTPSRNAVCPRLESWLGVATATATSPSVRFGLETALASLSRGSERGTGPGLACFDGEIPISGLLVGSRDRILRRARRLRNAGCRAVKLKVGFRPLPDDVELTRAVRKVLGDDVGLRLDANRSWSLEQAVRYGRAIGVTGVEYLEEPLRDPSRLEDFSDATGIPVALDESLVGLRPDDLEKHPAVAAVVLKPTLLGGIGRSSEWIAKALEMNVRPVVSACFESGVGLLALAGLAWSCTGDAVPAGLDTYRWLDGDVVRPRIPVQPRAIRWNDALARTHRIDTMRLCEVRHDRDPLPPRRGGRASRRPGPRS